MTDGSSTKHKISSKSFWSFIKQNKKDSSGVAPFYEEGVLKSDGMDKASILNKQCCSVFTLDSSQPMQNKGPTPYSAMPDIKISSKGVEKMLNGLNSKTASGRDNIHARFLKEMASDIAPILTHIFQKSLDTGGVPHQWKSANVTQSIRKEMGIKPLITARYR